MSGDEPEPFDRDLGDGVSIRKVRLRDAAELFELVDASRMHLREWLFWVDATASASDTEAFVRQALKQDTDGTGFQCCIVENGRILGVIGLNRLEPFHGRVEIGYWLAEAEQGRGIVTRACRALIDYSFLELELHRVEIRAWVENRRSRAVAERLGFTHEATLREADRLNGRQVDQAVYGLLRREWTS